MEKPWHHNGQFHHADGRLIVAGENRADAGLKPNGDWKMSAKHFDLPIEQVNFPDVLALRIAQHNFKVWQNKQSYPSTFVFHKSWGDFGLRLLVEAAFVASMPNEAYEILSFCNQKEAK